MVSKQLEHTNTRHRSLGPVFHHYRLAAVRDISLAQWGTAAVMFLMGYVWFLSALDKILSGEYKSGLAASLNQSLKGNPNRWYIHFVNWAVLPRVSAFAVLVEVGEILVVFGLLAGAIWWLIGPALGRGWSWALFLGSCGALIGGAIMTLNYYFLAGFGVPWLMTDDPFNEGLSIDGLMTLLAVALLIVQIVAWRQRSRQRLTGQS